LGAYITHQVTFTRLTTRFHIYPCNQTPHTRMHRSGLLFRRGYTQPRENTMVGGMAVSSDVELKLSSNNVERHDNV
jgi:hypothetical protein